MVLNIFIKILAFVIINDYLAISFLIINLFNIAFSQTKNIMKKSAFFKIAGFILGSFVSIFLIPPVFAQTETQRQQIQAAFNTSALNQLAIQFNSIYSIRKAEAEQWAMVISKKIRL